MNRPFGPNEKELPICPAHHKFFLGGAPNKIRYAAGAAASLAGCELHPELWCILKFLCREIMGIEQNAQMQEDQSGE